jgi:hypothetical protein
MTEPFPWSTPPTLRSSSLPAGRRRSAVRRDVLAALEADRAEARNKPKRTPSLREGWQLLSERRAEIKDGEQAMSPRLNLEMRKRDI